MTPAAGRGGNPPSREHPISAGSAGGRHPGGRHRPGQVTPPRAGSDNSPPPASRPGGAPSPGHCRRLPRATPAPEGRGRNSASSGALGGRARGCSSTSEDAVRAAVRRGGGSHGSPLLATRPVPAAGPSPLLLSTPPPTPFSGPAVAVPVLWDRLRESGQVAKRAGCSEVNCLCPGKSHN